MQERQNRPTQIIAKEFEHIVSRIILFSGLNISPESGADRGFDFLAKYKDEFWAIEVKFYRTPRAQISLIENAILRLKHQAKRADIGRCLLIVSSSLPPNLRESLATKFDIFLLDISDIANWASKSPDLFAELESLVDLPPIELIKNAGNLSDTSSFGQDKSQNIKKSSDAYTEKSLQNEDTRGSELCSEMKEIARGKKYWRNYEITCEKILRYLFPGDLHGWHKQKRTDDGLNRYDFVCRIKPSTEFWQFITQHLDSRYIVFEFKNYSEKIKQGQILTTEKYLLEKGLRKVGIIFSRKGSDTNATKMAQGAMREHGKLILVLNDDLVCEMLHMKENGDDPSDRPFELADNFLLTLPR
ncbi:hypothetical protein FIV06_07830 [Labrenzia sp. THAF191b]|uniref:restriction endonuclease n=1 Tax=unclassified Labrenzia TaxID=2648686 RepID=UPI001267C983|nr:MULTISPECIES: restriction endonuclease [unclassified Labrenzia]QFS97325.1 hypothetical protein FIV06_07830 [Labrenzia sp. THAF191b]QFT03640.1 hypothetical protein FIV05_07830 [Labrenzia sp. THAF191a]QFT15182.1 hypothetical protein FIV03_07835 [Labrenzia sp. THAF187b]